MEELQVLLQREELDFMGPWGKMEPFAACLMPRWHGLWKVTTLEPKPWRLTCQSLCAALSPLSLKNCIFIWKGELNPIPTYTSQDRNQSG